MMPVSAASNGSSKIEETARDKFFHDADDMAAQLREIVHAEISEGIRAEFSAKFQTAIRVRELSMSRAFVSTIRQLVVNGAMSAQIACDVLQWLLDAGGLSTQLGEDARRQVSDLLGISLVELRRGLPTGRTP